MSVLIKGMEMPTSCCQCPVNMYLCKRGYEYLLEHPALYDERADDCPLVPVPPHGRLIDADAMIRDIQKSVALTWYIKERNADMVKFLCLEDTVIEAEEGET